MSIDGIASIYMNLFHLFRLQMPMESETYGPNVGQKGDEFR